MAFDIEEAHLKCASGRRVRFSLDECLGLLSVAHDGRVSWDDLQEVKNFVWGGEAVAIEVYPPESRRVDSGNWRHLWRLRPGEFWPDLRGEGLEPEYMTLAERVGFAKGADHHDKQD